MTTRSKLAPVTHILPLVTMTRARLLPGNGRVLVSYGQQVAALDTVAEMPKNVKHTILDVAQILYPNGLEPGVSLLSHKTGDTLQNGDVIAETGGMFSRVVRAPYDCKVVAVGGNQILLEVEDETLSLKAAYSGVVRDIIADRGALIQSTGALIQGVWGNDKVNAGPLANKIRSPGELLIRERLDESLSQKVVFAGHCDRADVLQAACELKLAGVVLGSMTADLVPAALKMDIPLILLEGFGSMPINSFAYRLLTTNDKREACVNAFMPDSFTGIRPEIFIDSPVDGEVPHEITELRVNQEVRVIGAPYQSVIGTIVEFLPMPVGLPNQLTVEAAIVRLEDSRDVIIPLTNLDVIE